MTIPRRNRHKRARWSRATNPLFGLPNVIVTPHAAYYSEGIDPRGARDRRLRGRPRAHREKPAQPRQFVALLDSLAPDRFLKDRLHAESLQRVRPQADLLARFDALLPVWSISCVFADVMLPHRVMTSAIKPPFKAKAVGQAITVQLSKGDLVDPLKALEMGQPAT